MEMIRHSLEPDQLAKVREAMEEGREAMSYPEMEKAKRQPLHASFYGNRQQRRAAAAQARKGVPA